MRPDLPAVCPVCDPPSIVDLARGYRLLTWSMIHAPRPVLHLGPHLDGPAGTPLPQLVVGKLYSRTLRQDYSKAAPVTWGWDQHGLREYLAPRIRVVTPRPNIMVAGIEEIKLLT